MPKKDPPWIKEFSAELEQLKRLEALLAVHENELILAEYLIKHLRRLVDAGRPDDPDAFEKELVAWLAGWNAGLDAGEE